MVPAGERHKTLAGAEEVLRALARAGAERGDLVVAVGGGVVGDLAGFCAAVYQRGMAHVQVPTTLVAQVDSAYGGKTGVDLPEGKNYAGAFHQPAAVLCDPALLETLPREEHAAGFVEVVKTALIAGGPLWARVRRGEDPDARGDPGLRAHEAGGGGGGRARRRAGARCSTSATRSATRSRRPPRTARYRHGEAVGIGLLAALRLSGRDALRTEVAGLLEARGLPLSFSGASVDEVLELIGRDKKRTGGRVPFVLVEAPGDGDARARAGCGRAARRGRGGARRMNDRVDVLHGVNFDVLGTPRRRPLRRPHASPSSRSRSSATRASSASR